MGSRDLTDGIWIWPEGLVHYVETHHLALPAEFMERIAGYHGTVPYYLPRDDAEIDGTFWNSWYRRLVANH
jgi:hypothetical protein